MTMTIEIAPEVESALAAQAARLGVPVERYAADELRRIAQNNGEAREYSQEQSRAEKRRSHSRGLWTNLPGSVDEFLRERRECDTL